MLATREGAGQAREQLRVLTRALPDAVLDRHRDRLAGLEAFLAAAEERLPTEENVRRNRRRKSRRSTGE